MKLEQQIAKALVSHQELTVSEKVTKTFRQWLVSKGGRCTPKGDVITPKGTLVHFEPAKKFAFRVSLQEVAS
jgi:hypothetical protein